MYPDNKTFIKELEVIPDSEYFIFSNIENRITDRLTEFAFDIPLLKDLIDVYREIIERERNEYFHERIKSVQFLEKYIDNPYFDTKHLMMLNHYGLKYYEMVFPYAELLEPYNCWKNKFKSVKELISSGIEFDRANKLFDDFTYTEKVILEINWNDLNIIWETNPSAGQEFLTKLLFDCYLFLVCLEHIYIDDFIFCLERDKANELLVRSVYI